MSALSQVFTGMRQVLTPACSFAHPSRHAEPMKKGRLAPPLPRRVEMRRSSNHHTDTLSTRLAFLYITLSMAFDENPSLP